MPKRLGGIEELDIRELQPVHLAEHLGGFDGGVGHHEILRIPQRGSCALGEKAIAYGKALGAPERVLALKTATIGLDVSALLKSALACRDDDTLEPEVGGTIERAFAAEDLIFY